MNHAAHLGRLSSRLTTLVERLSRRAAAAARTEARFIPRQPVTGPLRRPSAAQTGEEERRYVLRLLAEGKITSAQADLLLDALEG